MPTLNQRQTPSKKHRSRNSTKKAADLVGKARYRTWRLYLAGSAHYFRTAKLDLYQGLLVKNDHGKAGLPLTRRDWY